MDIRRSPLSYEARLVQRNPNDIHLIVIHCTELPTLDEARLFGERIHHEDTQTGNSGHYYIDKSGGMFEFVSPKYVAHHVVGHNNHSIGIELINAGRYPNWFYSDNQDPTDEYSEAQVKTLIRLLEYLAKEYPTVKSVAGHEDLDDTWVPAEDDAGIMIKRKIDPGPLFPWAHVMSNTTLTRLRNLSPGL